ncbi:MAG TPA: PQQ-binding-like beta-propeller repeat protein [Vicinamibacteria bacterium]|nr:PQQ-binding-like beta-propeller repeat protein [Vicinamibacteria bacterium]
MTQKPIRLWPGVVIVILQWLGFLVVPVVLPEAAIYGVIGGLVGGPAAIVVWWLFFSRAPWSERIGALALMIAALAATRLLLHESVAQGNMGFQFLLVIPLLIPAFVAWAVATRRLPNGLRRAAMVVTILLACGSLTLVRSKGLKGNGMPEFAWRFSETPEEQLLARVTDEPMAIPPTPTEEETPEETPRDDASADPAAPPPVSDEEVSDEAPTAPPVEEVDILPPAGAPAAAAEWPGFRGPHRDGILPGVRIETNWSRSPPVELWRRPIGPGVSSFAVQSGLLYTQEQRGEDEIVACYDATSGEPVWMHRDTTRFWDSHVGAGPRATPALGGGRVYALGATGILNALDARDGTLVWSRNVPSDTGAKLPSFGFTSSPLVVDEMVIVHAGALAAYDLKTGDPRWFGPASETYSSPHLLTIDGVPQILLLGDGGATSVAPADGALLWHHSWPGIGILQPALTAEGDVLVSQVDTTATPLGTRRLAVEHRSGGWIAEERWTSVRLKPSFSPLVVHQGHAYGFDGRLLSCIDVEDGERKWKGGRYGSGQLLLLPDQDLLLVVSEDGELALVAATPDQFTELARFPAIEGKTWNQPVLVGDVLLVRNGEEMAAFRLSLPST